jgi:hypothetical protein
LCSFSIFASRARNFRVRRVALDFKVNPGEGRKIACLRKLLIFNGKKPGSACESESMGTDGFD